MVSFSGIAANYATGLLSYSGLWNYVTYVSGNYPPSALPGPMAMAEDYSGPFLNFSPSA